TQSPAAAKVLRGLKGPAELSASREARRHAAAEGVHHPAELASLEALHHPLHLVELLEQAVDVLDLYPRALRDAPPARAIDDARLTPLAGGHGIDDRD